MTGTSFSCSVLDFGLGGTDTFTKFLCLSIARSFLFAFLYLFSSLFSIGVCFFLVESELFISWTEISSAAATL